MVLLFGFQARTIVAQPLRIAVIAVPLLLQSHGSFAVGWPGARLLRLRHDIAGPACRVWFVNRRGSAPGATTRPPRRRSLRLQSTSAGEARRLGGLPRATT